LDGVDLTLATVPAISSKSEREIRGSTRNPYLTVVPAFTKRVPQQGANVAIGPPACKGHTDIEVDISRIYQ
jgi:hypothetical protein